MWGTRTDALGTDALGTDALDRFRVGSQEMVIIAKISKAARKGGPPDRHTLDLLTEVMIRHSIHAGNGLFVGMCAESRMTRLGTSDLHPPKRVQVEPVFTKW